MPTRCTLAMLLTVSMSLVGHSIAIGATIDLRTLSDVTEYEVGFCVRPSPDTVKNLPGHAFVTISVLAPSKQRTFLGIGHTVQPGTSPVSATWSYFGDSISGYLAEEKYTSAMQACLVAKVDRAEYEKVLALTQNPLATMGITPTSSPVMQAYKLGSEDCVGFMIGVANVLKGKGLKVPARGATELPLKYMQRLILSN